MLRRTFDSFTQLLFTLLAIYLTYLLLRYPTQALEYASTGLLLWFQKMIPTLLPFMIISGVMVRMNLTGRFARFFHPLFHLIWGTSLNGSYVILMGMLCGFPMGARVIGELCHAGRLSEKEGAFLLAFCNNIGPIYFISFVMSTLSLYGNYIPFLIMYGVPLCYGFILRLVSNLRAIKKSSPRTMFQAASIRAAHDLHISNEASVSSYNRPSLLSAVDDSVISGLIGIGKLGGYMVLFNLLNIMLLPFSSLPENFLSFCNCILEITSGISRTGINGLYMILILLPFGGFSCIAQTYSMVKDTGLSVSHYFMHKCIQTAITAIIYIFLLSFNAVSVYIP